MTNEPYDLDARLERIFSRYRPTIVPDEEEDAGESTDALIRRTFPDEWKAVEAHRERQYNEGIARHNADVMKAAWAELDAAGVDVTWQQFSNRLSESPTEKASREKFQAALSEPASAGQTRAQQLQSLADQRAAKETESNASDRQAEFRHMQAAVTAAEAR